MKITNNISELLGALAGDGFIGNYGKRKNQFIIQFTGHAKEDKKYLEYLENILKEIHREINVKYRIRNNAIWMYTYSKKLFYIFKEEFKFPEGKKGNKLSIPIEIKTKDQFMRKYIRGVFDTDGCVYFDKRKRYKQPYPRIRLEITSQKLFKEIANYLSKDFKTYIRSGKRPKFQRTYILEIYGHKQLQKWLKTIGFSNEKHMKRINASVAQW